jgi:signal transduction histidine kinase
LNKLFSFLGKPGSVYWWISRALIMFGVVMLAATMIQAFNSQRLIEHKIWAEMLKSISEGHVALIKQGSSESLPRTGVIRSWYLQKGSRVSQAPDYLIILPAGYYSSEGLAMNFVTDDRFHALITDLPSGRLITAIDITELEDQQDLDALLSVLWVCVLLVVIGALIAWLHSNLVLPVKDLADRMQAMDPGADPQTIGARLPTAYEQEEIQIIAKASNAHLERVERFIERERSLLDQASHEFRTPIAVISGAVDVLKQIELPDTSIPALNRIEHAVEDLSETMVALLYLAREANQAAEPVDVTLLHELLPRLIQDHAHLLGSKSADMKAEVIEPTYIAAPEAMVRIAVSNLIRNAIENTDAGLIELTLTKGIISVADSGCGFNPVEAARRYRDNLRQSAPIRGQGLGLFLISRICDRFGWKLSIEATTLGGTSATLDVTTSLIHPE